MSRSWSRWGMLALGCCTVLAACSPELNWRAARLTGLTVLLPCKPDAARRDVPLGTNAVSMDMLGCQAKGALFAISHVRLDNRQAVDAARAQWRQQALANVQARSVQEMPFHLARLGDRPVTAPPSEQAEEPSAEWLAAHGTRPDGVPTEARLLWLSRGEDLYHAAVYADPVSEEMVEMFFGSLTLQ